jgi:hypothetical protein
MSAREALRASVQGSVEFLVPGIVVTVVYLLQLLGVERAAQPNSVANGVLLGMLFMLGFTGSWFRRASLWRAMAEGTLITCVGAFVVAVKLVLH